MDFRSLTILLLSEHCANVFLNPAGSYVYAFSLRRLAPELIHPERSNLNARACLKESGVYALVILMYEVPAGRYTFAPSPFRRATRFHSGYSRLKGAVTKEQSYRRCRARTAGKPRPRPCRRCLVDDASTLGQQGSPLVNLSWYTVFGIVNRARSGGDGVG